MSIADEARALMNAVRERAAISFTARAHAEYKEGKDLRDMVKENLIAERIAIDSYREMILWIGDRDSTTRRMLEDILAQEEEHADEFADLLEGWIGN